jgi:DNA-3-methyladenine glycosylase
MISALVVVVRNSKNVVDGNYYLMKLSDDFYIKSAIELAPRLLGKLLCRKLNDEVFKYRITETEAYYGEDDTACHAHKGKTQRTKIMYEQGGQAYIYLCYGIHNLLNIVSGEKDFPEAVLIRGVDGYDGPGKLTKALKIERSLNGENLSKSDNLWLEDDGYMPKYKTAKRVGIDYATEEYKNKLWRFIKV